jgi:RTX calcium-binding nonapeptide repeat (4 copies)
MVDTAATSIVATATALPINYGVYTLKPGRGVSFDISFLSSPVVADNTYGYYLADADGKPLRGGAIRANVKTGGTASISLTAEQIGTAKSLGFFIITNGAVRNPTLQDGTALTFAKLNNIWTPIAGTTPLKVGGTKPSIFYTHTQLNVDSKTHVIDNAIEGNQNWSQFLNPLETQYRHVNVNVNVQTIKAPTLPIENPPTQDPNIGLVAPNQGTNLSRVTEFSTGLPFLNAFKMARRWRLTTSQNSRMLENLTPAEQSLYLDGDGYFKSLPAGSRLETYLFTAMSDTFQGGRYVVMYDGEATLNYGYGVTKVAGESKPGYDVINVTKQGIQMFINNINPQNYLRNIRVVREDQLPLYAAGVEFNPEFIDRLKDFGTLRFMDWMETNDHLSGAWKDRPETNDFSYNWNGVPAEVMIKLANLVGADPWFNMPVKASDEYLQNFAQLVKQQLNPKLKAHIEFSNEIWNQSFPQYQLANTSGRYIYRNKSVIGTALDEVLAIGPNFNTNRLNNYRNNGLTELLKNSDILTDIERSGNRAKYDAALAKGYTSDAIITSVVFDMMDQASPDAFRAWYADRAANMSQIFSTVFGTETASRLVRVLTTQTAQQGSEQSMLDRVSAIGTPSSLFDAFAVMGYFGLDIGSPSGLGNQVLNWIRTEPDGGFTKTFAEIDQSVTQVIGDFGYYKTVSNNHGLDLIAYEGGTHVVGEGSLQDNTQLTAFFNQLNYDPRMAAVYQRLLQGWKNAGGTVFNHFNDVGKPSKYGSWGALRWLGDSTSRWDALTGFNQNNARWWETRTADTFVQGKQGIGTAIDDHLNGTDQEDSLIGASGNDTLYGQAASDGLFGGDGSDRLYGNLGDDWLVGGLGADTFVYQLGDGADAIADFLPGTDRLEIRGISPDDLNPAVAVSGGALVTFNLAQGSLLFMGRTPAEIEPVLAALKA